MTRPGRRGRGTIALAMSACLTVACSDPASQPDEETARTPTVSPSRSPSSATESPTRRSTPDEVRAALPAFPTTANAGRLGRQLGRASQILRERNAASSDVREAAEFQQLAARALATAPAAVRRQVASRLDPPAARAVQRDARAAMLLLSMSQPQPELPRWRIVRPPPAAELLGHYRRAQRRTGVHWTYLAAIHLVETRMGRIRGVSTAGAVGPMQFLPTTWDLYGAGGDITDPRDAILAAGRLLRANGAPADMAEALWHYNPSDAYVGAVLEYARTMQDSPAAYDAYWHWRVLYRHVRGTYVLPVGYPEKRPVLLPGG